MKQIFVIFLLFLQSFAIGQEMVFSKDSIFITSNFPDNYTGNPEFYYSDTLWVFNVGDNILQIDSIRTYRTYSYILKIEFSDSTNYYSIYNNKHPSEKTIKFILSENDSAKLIFANPDLCPICKSVSNLEFFTDTLFFFSNSKEQPKYDMFISGDGTSDIDKVDYLTPNFYLYQNYPNPFNPTTNIIYSLSKSGFIKLEIFNLLGEDVATLVDGYQNAGIHNVKFEAKNISSGIYIYKLISSNRIFTKKMILLR